MNATLPEIRIQLADSIALRDKAGARVRDIVLGRMRPDPDLAERRRLMAEFSGYEREAEALAKIEAELIANGRADTEMPHASETRFGASAIVDVPTPGLAAASASSSPREPRETNGADEPKTNRGPVLPSVALPAAGDCF